MADHAPRFDDNRRVLPTQWGRTLFVFTLVLTAVTLLGMRVRTATKESVASSSQSCLNRISYALYCYQSANGTFPPAYVTDETGKPLHSWRTLILPYLGHPELAARYNFSEPWNGPNNSKLANQMPSVFWSASEPRSTEFTNVVLITGPGTAFDGNQVSSLDQFQDGHRNTILITEIANSKIPWLAPMDLDVRQFEYQVNSTATISPSAVAWRKPYVVFADSMAVYWISDHIPAATFQALTTHSGGESIDRDIAIEKGHIGRGNWMK